MHEASVTIFPSITPPPPPRSSPAVIRPSMASPARRGSISARQEVAYYGDDFWVIAREGFGEFIHDFLLRLNGDRLKAPTMFEMVERTGRRAACLNYLVLPRHCPRTRSTCPA